MELEFGLSVGTLAHKLRRFERLHRIAWWLRRSFWRGLVEALIEWARWAFSFSEKFGPPDRTFSVYQALRTGHPKLNGRIVLEDQGNPVVTKNSLFVLGPYEEHIHQPWPILWSQHPCAHLATRSLALVERKRVCIESAYGHARVFADPASHFFRLPRPVRLEGNWTSIVSRWVPSSGNPNYTHWLLDALPRLALLPEFPPDTRVLVPAKLPSWANESLVILGLQDRCRLTAETHLELENYYFSSPTSMLECYNPYAINFLRSALLPKKDSSYSGPKKFFVARTGSVRNPKNAAQLHRFFKAIGWEVIQPSDLTFAQEMKLFADAEAICGSIGSGMTNAVFCQPGCRILLLAQDFILDGWLDWISQVVKADYHFLICPSGYQHTVEPDLDRLRKTLQDLGFFD